jgi:predicted PolB exonuclease-like 3'-5' exonuclease
MTSRDFAFWLQGFFEITGTNKIDEGQAEMIKNHLNLVFKHEIDPSLNGSKSKEEVQDLQDIHDGKPLPEKDQAAVDYLNGVFTNKPHKLHGGWSSGSSDGTLLRC